MGNMVVFWIHVGMWNFWGGNDTMKRLRNLLHYLLRRNWRLFWRECRLLYQRVVRGWDDSDTWSLDYTTAKFVLPRLKRFKELSIAVPSEFCQNGVEIGSKIWNRRLDQMIYAMEKVIQHTNVDMLSTDEINRMNKGLQIFGQHFTNLWW
jgi:hypothetical protein